MQEMWLRPLDREDSLEQKLATHSGILAWKIPLAVEPVGYSPWSHKELDMMSDWARGTPVQTCSPIFWALWSMEMFSHKVQLFNQLQLWFLFLQLCEKSCSTLLLGSGCSWYPGSESASKEKVSEIGACLLYFLSLSCCNAVPLLSS